MLRHEACKTHVLVIPKRTVNTKHIFRNYNILLERHEIKVVCKTRRGGGDFIFIIAS